jgi:alpha-tubulin suppressor-like RCC1 family protein
VADCNQHACVNEPVTQGTVLANNHQVSHDCQTAVCDGNGAIASIPDDLDLPSDASDSDCVLAACQNGSPSMTFAAQGTVCSQGASMTGFCLGDSTCGECLPSQKKCFGGTLETCPSGSFVHTICEKATPVCNNEDCVGVEQLSAGIGYTCARLSNGRVTCWGLNNLGQLGIEDMENSDKTRTVIGLTDATSIASGFLTSCAIKKNGKLVCWGNNDSGQLGSPDLASDHSSSPVEVAGLDQVIAVAVGYQFTCAIAGPNREAYCWGLNADLQLGSGNPSEITPVARKIDKSLSKLKQVVAGTSHACALDEGGAVYCWGKNDEKQVGVDGAATMPPIKVNLTSAISLAAGTRHSCAILNSADSVVCWGANINGQLGLGTATPHELPTKTNFTKTSSGSLTAGDGFTCLSSLLDIHCVGKNDISQLGGGDKSTASPVLSLVKVLDAGPQSNPSLSFITKVVAGFDHACALVPSGGALCWGDNQVGQVGIKNLSLMQVTYAQPVSWSSM